LSYEKMAQVLRDALSIDMSALAAKKRIHGFPESKGFWNG
jgi:hypothetical protein